MTPQIVFCTCPDSKIAEEIARVLLEQHLAACINIIPQLTSIYTWQNKIETTNECLLLIKTTAEKYSVLEEWIKMNHPYKVPEIVAVNIAKGLPSYLEWIVQTTKDS